MMQTFFQNEPLIVGNDQITSLLEDGSIITRFVKISHPIDIYFAMHCLKYEREIDYVPILGNTFSQEIRSFPNITTFKESGGFLITHPFKENPNDSFVFTRDPLDPASSGYYVPEPRLLNQIEKYLENFRECIKNTASAYQILERAKKDFYQKSKSNYLKAIATNIQRELANKSHANTTTGLVDLIEYIGVVGSVAKESANPRDVDIVIVLKEYSENIKHVIEDVSKSVGEAYSFKGMTFEPVFEIGPIKPKEGGIFPIQILLHTDDTIREWDKFILYDWSLTGISLYRNYEFSQGKVDFSVSDVVSSRYGCAASREVIKQHVITQKQWCRDGDRYVIDSTSPNKLSEIQLIRYMSYSAKWLLTNISRAIQDDSASHISSDYIERVLDFFGCTPNDISVLIPLILNRECEDFNDAVNSSLAFFSAVEKKDIREIECNYPVIKVVKA